MSPFDLRGPQFLVFYLILGTLVVTLLFMLRRLIDPAGAVKVDMSDPYLIAFLRGTILSKNEMTLVIEAHGVGYEVFCSPQVIEHVGAIDGAAELFIHTHYKADGAALFGFNLIQEKSLFLSLIKV